MGGERQYSRLMGGEAISREMGGVSKSSKNTRCTSDLKSSNVGLCPEEPVKDNNVGVFRLSQRINS